MSKHSDLFDLCHKVNDWSDTVTTILQLDNLNRKDLLPITQELVVRCLCSGMIQMCNVIGCDVHKVDDVPATISSIAARKVFSKYNWYKVLSPHFALLWDNGYTIDMREQDVTALWVQVSCLLLDVKCLLRDLTIEDFARDYVTRKLVENGINASYTEVVPLLPQSFTTLSMELQVKYVDFVIQNILQQE